MRLAKSSKKLFGEAQQVEVCHNSKTRKKFEPNKIMIALSKTSASCQVTLTIKCKFKSSLLTMNDIERAMK